MIIIKHIAGRKRSGGVTLAFFLRMFMGIFVAIAKLIGYGEKPNASKNRSSRKT
ncbi:hypothetical protein J2S16_004832 [Cytobacillus kochii]|nr:hypothetical protein [Cytobacillus kochii]